VKPYFKEGYKTLFIKFMYKAPGWLKAKRIQLNTHETNETLAIRKGVKLREEYIARHEAGAGLTLSDLQRLDEERAATEGYDERHRKTEIGPHWNNLKIFFKTPGDVSYESLKKYVIFCRNQTKPDGSKRFSDMTIRRHCATLRRGLACARLDGHTVPIIADEAWPKFKKKGKTKGKKQSSGNFSPEQIRDLISSLSGHAFDTALIYACTGMRAEEGEEASFRQFTPMDNMPGCAGRFLIIGKEDDDREVGIPVTLLPILKRALPLKVDHKNVFKTAAEEAGMGTKFNRRDFRAAYNTTVSEEDHYGARLTMGHSGETNDLYQNIYAERLARLALFAWARLAPAPDHENLAPIVAKNGYYRRRVKKKKPL